MFLKQLSLLGKIMAKHLRTYSTKMTNYFIYFVALYISANYFTFITAVASFKNPTK